MKLATPNPAMAPRLGIIRPSLEFHQGSIPPLAARIHAILDARSPTKSPTKRQSQKIIIVFQWLDRTDAPLPKQMRYRAALYPDKAFQTLRFAIMPQAAPASESRSYGIRLVQQRRSRRRQRLNKACSTLSPGLMPSCLLTPPLISSTESTGSPEGIVRVESGSVRSAMRAIVPSARMNSMSNEI